MRKDIVAELKDAFPRQQLTMATFNSYVDHLDDIPELTLLAAVTSLIRSEEFFPSIALIRETCASMILHLPTVEEAIDQIEARRLWRLRLDDMDDNELTEPSLLHPLVKQVLDHHCGGLNSYLHSENPSMAAALFTKSFTAARAAEIRVYQTGPFMKLLESA